MQVLRRGDVGPAVAEIRSTLIALGLLSGNPQDGEIVFDAEVEHAVRAFQQQRGLITDGLVGPATYASLRAATY
ncbi:peptidoglycan-binding protein, partial [Kutzneria sp. 744]|uniref:peptidoglycan-binding domain-containing protein n=1 Tax=Kutzneria sp. (strain 744) TaxID=345341 RepID=UPI0003EEB952